MSAGNCSHTSEGVHASFVSGDVGWSMPPMDVAAAKSHAHGTIYKYVYKDTATTDGAQRLTKPDVSLVWKLTRDNENTSANTLARAAEYI